MTDRAEQRKACIEAMKAAYTRPEWPRVFSLLSGDDIFAVRMTTAFDALNGLVRVCPVDVTMEMNAAAMTCDVDDQSLKAAINAAIYADDLTRPTVDKS